MGLEVCTAGLCHLRYEAHHVLRCIVPRGSSPSSSQFVTLRSLAECYSLSGFDALFLTLFWGVYTRFGRFLYDQCSDGLIRRYDADVLMTIKTMPFFGTLYKVRARTPPISFGL